MYIYCIEKYLRIRILHMNIQYTILTVQELKSTSSEDFR